MINQLTLKTAAIVTMVLTGIMSAQPAQAVSVAIVQGSFYTPDLKNALLGAGETVTEITSYTAASLATCWLARPNSWIKAN